jgi:hypothetical protein
MFLKPKPEQTALSKLSQNKNTNSSKRTCFLVSKCLQMDILINSDVL